MAAANAYRYVSLSLPSYLCQMNDVPTQFNLDLLVVSSFLHNDLGFRIGSYLALPQFASLEFPTTSWPAVSTLPFEHPLRKGSTWMFQVLNLCDSRPICAREGVRVIE